MSLERYDVKMKILREVFYDKQSMHGIYGALPVEQVDLERNKFNNVAIKGDMRYLREGEVLQMRLEGAYQDNYGKHYKVLEIEPEKLDTIEDQDNFLSSILTERQYESLKTAYPNDKIVDLILEDKIDTSLTEGIKERSLEKIKEKVEENSHISLLISKLNALDLTTNAIGRLVKHFGSSQKCVDVIDTNIYKLCEVPMFGFRTVDDIALKRGDSPTGESRIIAYINYYLTQQMKEGHSWSYIDDLVDSTLKELDINVKFINDTISRLKKDSWSYYFDEKRISKKRARSMELEVYRHLKRINNSYLAPNALNMEEKIKEVESYQQFQFTDEQRKAILEGSQHGVMVVNGLAGSGKTGTVKGLIDSLGIENYMTCALSGSAVKVLSKRGIHASTIHRMLGYKGDDFMHNEEYKLSYDLVVIDEMSMIDIPLLLSVLKSIRNGTKLILVGDSGQLPPINFGHPLENLLETDRFASYELTKVHRQAEKSGILSLASKVRSGEQPLPYNSTGSEIYGELRDQTIIGYSKAGKDEIPYDVLSIAERYKQDHVKTPHDLMNFQVIVPNRIKGALSVRSMNIELQGVFNDLNKPHLADNGYNFREGDKILLRGNSYNKPLFDNEVDFRHFLDLVDMLGKEEAEETLKGNETNVYNGTVGFVSAIVGNHMLVQFDEIDGLVSFEKGEDLEKIELGYAASVHQTQGDSVKNVILCLDFGAYTLLSRQLVYTGITRTSFKGVILAETNALHRAVGNSISGKRRTFLREFVIEDT